VHKADLLLPVLSAAANALLDPAYQFAYGRLVASRLSDVRLRLLEEFGDVYSQERVARCLQKSQTWISNLEIGQRRIDTSALLQLCAVYNVSPDVLVKAPSGKREMEQMAAFMREYHKRMTAAIVNSRSSRAR
jgi:plasmid maintenance system antidote protein VapI